MAQTDSIKANKRHSLLLPKDTLSNLNAVNRRIPGPDSNNGPRPRPMSVVGLESLTSQQRLSRSRAETSNSTIRSTSNTTQRSDSSQPLKHRPTTSTSSLSRIASTRKPTEHSRAQSTVGLVEPRSRLPSTTILRKPSAASTSISTISAAATSRPKRTVSSALPAPVSTTTIRARPQSVLIQPSFRTGISAPQQHYSPRKYTGSKQPPLISSVVHSNPALAPSLDPSIALPPSAIEPLLAQTHLLHLALLHVSLPDSLADFTASAQSALSRKHAAVVRHLTSVHEAEREASFRANVAALVEWGGGVGNSMATMTTLGQNIQVLSGVLNEALILCGDPAVEATRATARESGARHLQHQLNAGRLRAVVYTFSEWAECVGEMWAFRDEISNHNKSSNSNGGGGCEFIDGLGREWREEAREVRRRLVGLLLSLDRGKLEHQLPKVEPSQLGEETKEDGAILQRVVRGVRELLEGAVKEVELVLMVEKVVVEMEEEWVDGQLNGVI